MDIKFDSLLEGYTLQSPLISNEIKRTLEFIEDPCSALMDLIEQFKEKDVMFHYIIFFFKSVVNYISYLFSVFA